MGMACHDPRASHTAPTGRDAQGDEGDHPVGQRLAAALPELCVCKDMPWSLAVRCSTQSIDMARRPSSDWFRDASLPAGDLVLLVLRMCNSMR